MRNKSGNIEAMRKGIANEILQRSISSKNDERKVEKDSEARPEITNDQLMENVLIIVIYKKGYHSRGNNYSFDALQTNCFGINIKL